jgi:hypothetical protein
MLRRTVAIALLAGCATTGGKLAAVGTAVFGVVGVANVSWCLDLTITTDDGTYRDSCPSNAPAVVMLALAAAAAVTGIGFEIAHRVHEVEPPNPLSHPLGSPGPSSHGELPPALGFAAARALVHRFSVERELGLADRETSAHFDRPSGAWIFEWQTANGVVKLAIDATQQVFAARCEATGSGDCEPIP